MNIQNLDSCIFWNETFFDISLVAVYVGIAIKNFPFYVFVLIDASSLTCQYKFVVLDPVV
jgi:hypothetical protein